MTKYPTISVNQELTQYLQSTGAATGGVFADLLVSTIDDPNLRTIDMFTLSSVTPGTIVGFRLLSAVGGIIITSVEVANTTCTLIINDRTHTLTFSTAGKFDIFPGISVYHDGSGLRSISVRDLPMYGSSSLQIKAGGAGSTAYSLTTTYRAVS